MLGLSTALPNLQNNPNVPKPTGPPPPGTVGAGRFIAPLDQVEFQLSEILGNLQKDAWPVLQGKRPMRCTGVAMSVAVGLLEVSDDERRVDDGFEFLLG
jgi:protein transport protein SEC23